jgi:hypothetical protein
MSYFADSANMESLGDGGHFRPRSVRGQAAGSQGVDGAVSQGVDGAVRE